MIVQKVYGNVHNNLIFFIEQFGQHKFNCLIGELGLAIIMWVVCCKGGMFEQKMIGEDLNGYIDKDAFLNH
jgi:hypothetical protein